MLSIAWIAFKCQSKSLPIPSLQPKSLRETRSAQAGWNAARGEQRREERGPSAAGRGDRLCTHTQTAQGSGVHILPFQVSPKASVPKRKLLSNSAKGGS